MNKRFVFNETSYFGWGCRKILVDEIKKRKYKRALVVTDDNILKVGIANKVTDLLDANKLVYEIFSDVVPNPTIKNVKKGLKIANKYHVDYIIAVGGGSVIDTAKAIGIIFANPEHKDVKSLAGVTNTNNKSLPIIALPTTFGTAAETTINYVITDEDAQTKMVCIDPNDIPELAIIDAELMSEMPIGVAAATGMDALTHAIECFVTKAHNEMSDMFALKAINLIYNNLEKAINKNKDAIENMAMAQYIAGMGFSNVGLGIVHSMAHQLGAVYDTPHGVANALLLPYVMEFNSRVCGYRFPDMAKAMGLDIDGLTSKQIITLVINGIRDLEERLDLPQHLSEVGVLEDDIPLLAKKALDDPCVPGNPREVSILEFEELFKKAF